MKIRLKLFAHLMEYLPTELEDKHTAVLHVDEDTTPYQLIDELHIPRQMAHLVLLNGVFLRPDERNKPVLKEEDTIAVFPPVAGG